MKTKVIGIVGAAFKETNYKSTITYFSFKMIFFYSEDIQLLIYHVVYT